ncbi:MAG: glycosyltransferase family 2 protein [Rikenellaceae bacterium]
MVTVLLSTYNGEQYLEAQLTSLVAQKGVEFQIVVRDDGSTDATCQILDRWQSKGFLRWQRGKNLGFARSFLSLLHSAPQSQYYAFCDQDDIWLSDKLSCGVREIEGRDSPTLYCSNLSLFDGSIVGEYLHPLDPKITLESSLVSSVATGCTMLFNDSLREILDRSDPREIAAHDLWTLHTALLFGDVYYDSSSYILYRQHGDNQIGARASWGERWLRRLGSFRHLHTQHYREVEARELIRCYGDRLAPQPLEQLRCVAHYRESFRRRLHLLLSPNFVAQSLEATLWVKIRIILGYL